MLLQGLVLMVTGVGIVFLFLSLLVAVLSVSAKIIPRFNHILPDEMAKLRTQKNGAPKVHADDGIAIAIALAAAHHRAAETAKKEG